MDDLKFLVIFALLICVKAFYLEHVCEEISDTELSCGFQSEGVYAKKDLSEEIERVVFDRLTNSRIDLSNLPSVDFMEIKSALFDQERACDHIMNAKQTVRLIFGGNVIFVCVSIIILIKSSKINPPD